MKRNLGLLQNMRVPALAGLVFLITLACVEVRAKSDPFNHLIVFGDSLSDTGNYFRLADGNVQPSCVNGRFCNGPLWVEYLAARLGMEYQQADNFAVAGATTGTLNSNGAYPGLANEIQSFLTGTPLGEPERALYIVEAGANDFFVALSTAQDPRVTIANGVNHTVAAVQQLWASGARNILVMNLPDLGVTPMASSMGLNAGLHQVCATYNQYLSMALDQLALAGIPTIRLDAFAVLDQMAGSPAKYGFSNVTVPYVYVLSGDADQFLFWDPVHPTTGAHNVLAETAVEQLLLTFSPSNGNGSSDAAVMGLNGLVNASLQH